MNIIEAEGINKFFGAGQNRVHVLKDMSFAIEEGDFVAIIGQSGSGKSTLMNILGCLDTQSSGVCRIGGVDIGTLGSDELAELRGRRIGFIFQRYNLLSTLSATENVALPAVYSGVDKKTRLDRAKSLLADLGLPNKLENKPNELSGGQQQRVSIARALMNGGSIILADEPTGALDSKSGENVMDILTELNRRGHTIIVVTLRASPAGSSKSRTARSFPTPGAGNSSPHRNANSPVRPAPPSCSARISSSRRSKCRCRPSSPTRCDPC